MLGNNMFAYCLNNPVNCYDPSGTAAFYTSTGDVNPFSPVYFGSGGGGGGGTICAKPGSLPYYGEPNSVGILLNPDGTPKQKRWYGPDGKPDRDRDYNHPGDGPFPHDHEWEDGKRGDDHLDPSPDYESSWEPLLGAGVVIVCTIGIAVVAADDITGIGAANDFLFAPLSAGIGEGLVMLFG